jgi:hypothetical protein
MRTKKLECRGCRRTTGVILFFIDDGDETPKPFHDLCHKDKKNLVVLGVRYRHAKDCECTCHDKPSKKSSCVRCKFDKVNDFGHKLI